MKREDHIHLPHVEPAVRDGGADPAAAPPVRSARGARAGSDPETQAAPARAADTRDRPRLDRLTMGVAARPAVRAIRQEEGNSWHISHDRTQSWATPCSVDVTIMQCNREYTTLTWASHRLVILREDLPQARSGGRRHDHTEQVVTTGTGDRRSPVHADHRSSRIEARAKRASQRCDADLEGFAQRQRGAHGGIEQESRNEHHHQSALCPPRVPLQRLRRRSLLQRTLPQTGGVADLQRTRRMPVRASCMRCRAYGKRREEVAGIGLSARRNNRRCDTSQTPASAPGLVSPCPARRRCRARRAALSRPARFAPQPAH